MSTSGEKTHTPTNKAPRWMVERHDQDDGSISYEIWDHNPVNYRRVAALNDAFVEEGKHARKDSATIARAVNCHDAMLAALKDAQYFILAPAEDLKDGVVSRIRAALALATPAEGERT